MTDTTGREDAVLAAGLAGWLADRGRRGAEVRGLRRPSAGFSSETLFVDATWTDGGATVERALVVRMAPSGPGSFPAYDLTAQWEAQRAAAAAGVPVADPVLEVDPSWLGGPFLVMTRVEGHVVGGLPHLDRWLGSLGDADRARVHRNLVEAIAAVHRAEPPAGATVPRRDLGAELDFWERYLGWSSGGAPVAVLAAALRWCRQRCPDRESAPVLLWGDARFENAVLGDDLEVRAVLDWDMTSVGAPEHDLAWFTALDATMFHLFGQRAAGFPDREGTVAIYEEAGGRRVRDLGWFETLAMLRSAAVMTRLGYLRRDAGEPPLLPIEDNPVLDLLGSRLH
jgi:aminoglycoside phosphotransferase (APT) family kinase protein